jgi:hypothetical protein
MRLQIVHLRVNDAESGQPIACRIRITDPGGQEYSPLGRPLEFSCNRGEDVGGHCLIGKERWFSINGACEIPLPPGELRIQVRKGLAYTPLDQVINHPAGKMSIRLGIQRQNIFGEHQARIDMRCHFQTPHSAMLDAAAEDLHYVQLLAEPTIHLGKDGNSYISVPNLEAFSGQKECLPHVIVNTHNRHSLLGSLALLNSHRVVYPLSFGGHEGSDDWSLRDWAGQCHRKGGFVVWTKPFASNKPFAGEALALAILGEIDAYELSPDHLSNSLRGWYQLLDAGINLPLVGGSGRVGTDRPLGALQTLSHLGGSEGNDWVLPLKIGAGKVTNGPIPNYSPGDKVGATFSALSVTPFDRVELIVNGEVVATASSDPVEADDKSYAAYGEYNEPIHGWVAARVVDDRKSVLNGNMNAFGHTSAHWIGEPTAKPQAVQFLMDHLDRGMEWVENHGRFEQPKFKKQLLDTFAEARAKLLSGKRA